MPKKKLENIKLFIKISIYNRAARWIFTLGGILVKKGGIFSKKGGILRGIFKKLVKMIIKYLFAIFIITFRLL
jgi:hypothetical protein